jgi:hypothetical protein
MQVSVLLMSTIFYFALLRLQSVVKIKRDQTQVLFNVCHIILRSTLTLQYTLYQLIICNDILNSSQIIMFSEK